MNILTNSAPDENFPDLWVGMDPELQFINPQLPELLAYWNNKRQGRAMPSRADIDPFDLKKHLGNLVLIDVEHSATDFRLRYRLVGSNITARMGRDVTNKYYDEVYDSDVVESANASFCWIFENRAPLRICGRAPTPDKAMYRYEILNLPLSNDGRSVNMVLGEMIFGMPTLA